MLLHPAPNGYMNPEDPGEPGTGEPRWSVHLVEARLLSELCRGLVVLEIGTGLGVSTREIARQAKWVYTVDIDPWIKTVVVPTLPHNTTFADDINKLPVVDFDAAFIDGLHSYQQCSQDIGDARRLVKPGGLIILHDTNMVNVKSAARDSRLGFIHIETPVGMGLAWNRKETHV